MSEITRVALDAMGGDNAPGEIVKGAVEAVQRRDDIKILLTGKEEVLKKELSAYTYPKEQIEIVNATEVIETAEPPVKAASFFWYAFWNVFAISLRHESQNLPVLIILPHRSQPIPYGESSEK